MSHLFDHGAKVSLYNLAHKHYIAGHESGTVSCNHIEMLEI